MGEQARAYCAERYSREKILDQGEALLISRSICYNTGMAGLKQIMYGVTDFALMRAGNAYFVDRTDLIRELEKTRYTVFLRPRRFGKAFCRSERG